MEHLDEPALKKWIESSLASGANVLAAGYQGQTLYYDDGKNHFVVKVPHGQGLARWFNRHMLRHEYTVYQKLGNFKGAPTCHGLIDGQYLVLEFIKGRTIRTKRPLDEDEYHRRLFNYIETMHAKGVAHMDLKRKDNLLVKSDESPCILDFGAAVIYKKGIFHPFNHYRFRLGKQFDYNAWIKHKYHNRSYREITMWDREYFRPTWVEVIASIIKAIFTKTA